MEDRIVVESERAAQSGRAGVIEEVLAQDPPRFRVRWDDGAHEHLRSLGRCREDRAAQERAREGLTDGEAARRDHEYTGNGARSSSVRGPPLRYFPRDFFFCFFTFRLCIGAFASVPRETGLGTPCFFDFPAMPILLDRG